MGIASSVVKEISQEIETKTREFYEFILPPVDIHTTEAEIIVTIDMPGFEKDAIKVHLDGNILIIRAKRDTEKKMTVVSAQRPQIIDKKIQLPAEASDIAEPVETAAYADGVLEIIIPRQTRGRNIPVN